MDRNYYNDELMHFGIKGMKWGVRRFQNADGSLKPAGEKRYGGSVGERVKLKAKAAGHKAYGKVFELNEKTYKKSNATLSKMNERAKNEQFKKADEAQQKLNKMKAEKTKADKANVSKYKKQWDEAEKASNMADEKWNNVKEQYKALGKNRIERMINASRNNTDAAKKYSKAFDDAERASNIADAKWDQVKESYKATGRNRVERMINNVKYDPDKKN